VLFLLFCAYLRSILAQIQMHLDLKNEGPTKYLQHTFETSATMETYVCNIEGENEAGFSHHGGRRRRASTSPRSWVPLGSDGDDLRRPGTCAQPPSAGTTTATTHPDSVGLGKRSGRHYAK
jgi:hypothetical protein